MTTTQKATAAEAERLIRNLIAARAELAAATERIGAIPNIDDLTYAKLVDPPLNALSAARDALVEIITDATGIKWDGKVDPETVPNPGLRVGGFVVSLAWDTPVGPQIVVVDLAKAVTLG